MLQRLRLKSHSRNSRSSGMKSCLTLHFLQVMKSLTAWQFGISTSVLLHTILPALLHTLNQESDVEWDSAILLRICLVQHISFQTRESVSVFLMLQQLSSLMDLHIISSSHLQSAEMQTLVLTSMMTLFGSFSVLDAISVKLETRHSSRKWFLSTTQRLTRQQCMST